MELGFFFGVESDVDTDALSGTAGMTLDAQGMLTGLLALSGEAPLLLDAQGDLTGDLAVQGSASLALEAAGVLTGELTLSGAATMALTASGLLVGTAAIAGGATLALAAAGALSGTSSLAGSASMALSASGDLTVTVPAPTVTSISPSSGPRRSSSGRVITGTGFVNGATVSVGGVAATSVTWNSATQLTITTGVFTSDGAKNVVVTNPDAQTGTLVGGYTVAMDPLDAATATALWLDGNDAATITHSGGVVSQWDDKSGNARHFSQATPANRPTWGLTGPGGKGEVTFDGVNDNIQRTGSPFAALTAGHIFIVIKQLASTAAARVCWTLGSNVGYYPFTNGNIYEWAMTTTRFDNRPPGVPLSQYNIYEIISTSSEFTLLMNAVSIGTRGTNTVAFNAAIGFGGTANGLQGPICEVALFAGKLSTQDATDFRAALKAKWNTP